MIERIKVLFLQKDNNGEIEIESIWCIKNGDYYVIDNIPFIAKRIALGDTIKVEYDNEEDAYYFDDFISVSGNTTVRLYFNDEKMIERTRKKLNNYNCASEVFLDRKIVAVNIPKYVEYSPIKEFFDKGEIQNIWVYEESCLSHEL
jgi:hypothetical protein